MTILVANNTSAGRSYLATLSKSRLFTKLKEVESYISNHNEDEDIIYE